LRFGTIEVHSTADQHQFEVPVYLDELTPEMVHVELYAEALAADEPPERHVMNRGAPLTGAVNGYLYTASVSTARPSDHYTPRIVPYHVQASVPLDAAHILWHS
jgi:glycogen phosphorylase